MTYSYWQSQSRRRKTACDMAVVGAGIVGSSTAYWLGRLAPSKRIVLVDAASVGGAASGRNAGFLLQGAQSDYLKDCAAYGVEIARRLWRFTRENRDALFEELDGCTFDLESSGSLVVAGSDEEDERLRNCVRVMRSDGAPATYFNPKETNRRLSSVGFGGSLYVPSGAVMNPIALVRCLTDRSGADILQHEPVRALEPGPNGVTIDTECGTIEADRAVLAVNAWSPLLVDSLRTYVHPVRAQMLSTEPCETRWLDVPIYSHDGYYYARQLKNGVVVAGGARHQFRDTEVGYDDVVTDGVQDAIESYIAYHFPQARPLSIERRWSGVMGFSPDHLPMVGHVPGIPGSLWAAGFSGHGMGYGFRFGRMMAEMALGDDQPEGLDLFTVERLGIQPDADAVAVPNEPI